jgi:hypothetical protein
MQSVHGLYVAIRCFAGKAPENKFEYSPRFSRKICRGNRPSNGLVVHMEGKIKGLKRSMCFVSPANTKLLSPYR